MNISAVCTHVYQMRNLPHTPNGLFTVLLGPKLKMKMNQGMALGSVVWSCMFLSKCKQSKLINATQMTLPRNVFLKFLNPCQHGNSDYRNFKIKTYLFLVYDSQEFCQSAEWQTSMAPSHHTNLSL